MTNVVFCGSLYHFLTSLHYYFLNFFFFVGKGTCFSLAASSALSKKIMISNYLLMFRLQSGTLFFQIYIMKLYFCDFYLFSATSAKHIALKSNCFMLSVHVSICIFVCSDDLIAKKRNPGSGTFTVHEITDFEISLLFLISSHDFRSNFSLISEMTSYEVELFGT